MAAVRLKDGTTYLALPPACGNCKDWERKSTKASALMLGGTFKRHAYCRLNAGNALCSVFVHVATSGEGSLSIEGTLKIRASGSWVKIETKILCRMPP